MKDSILKGAGNSRFLKSAVPAGTSWADALAMLKAGTFPIDFNGINAEGFQQVGTPLNKANLLKDATAAQIGLPPSTTPDGMFQALGNTGELHVWRKTVKNAADVPAGYTITDKIGVGSVVSNSARITISYSDAVDVDDKGNVSLREPITTETYSVRELNQLGATNPTYISGKFFTATTYKGIMYRKPSVSWVFGHDDDGTYFHGGFVVNGYAKVPAGTTTTYPVSTNPNAYQEGDDAKPAGYVVGSKTETWAISSSVSTATARATLASSVSVGDDGTVSLVSPNTNTPVANETNSQYVSVARDYLRGSFLERSDGTIWYIPSDANVTSTTSGVSEYGAPYNYCFVAEMQPVTGYSAIPAGTTIEYLGKLGDKARVQVVSYVGTGTYGINHKNSLTFDFAPKLVIVAVSRDIGNGYQPHPSSNGWKSMFLWIPGINGSFAYGSDVFFTDNGKKLSWYANSEDSQCNTSGSKYIAIAIG